MSFSFKQLEIDLAKYKVYDALPYVNSLQEILEYKTISYELANYVYNHRLTALKEKEQEYIKALNEFKKLTVDTSIYTCTNFNITNLQVDDILFLKKTTFEFFHYARICIDFLYSIINKALLGDNALSLNNKHFISNVVKQISADSNFDILSLKLKKIKNCSIINYVKAFDNYSKHIQTIHIPISDSILFGDKHIFSIREFSLKGQSYPQKNAISIINAANKLINCLVFNILKTVQLLLPHCQNTNTRFNRLIYKGIMNTYTDISYTSFFIETEQDVSELPNDIKILPLRISNNGKVNYSIFTYDKIFIKSKNDDISSEAGIIGYAQLKKLPTNNELYSTFTVYPCDIDEYNDYILSCVKRQLPYQPPLINPCSMIGSIIIIHEPLPSQDTII